MKQMLKKQSLICTKKMLKDDPLTVSEAKPMVPRDNAPRAESSESSEAPAADPDALNQTDGE